MSTSYQRLKIPFTSVRAEKGVAHSKLTIFINHANTGILTLRNEEVSSFLWSISESQDDLNCPVIRNSDGIRCNRTIDPDECLISENGEITSLAKLSAEKT
jgi:hypothetical protein